MQLLNSLFFLKKNNSYIDIHYLKTFELYSVLCMDQTGFA